MSGIIYTLRGVAVCWKFQINNATASDSTDGEIRYNLKACNKISHLSDTQKHYNSIL